MIGENIGVNIVFGSWVESEVVGFFVFSHIRMMSFYFLGYVRLSKGKNNLTGPGVG